MSTLQEKTCTSNHIYVLPDGRRAELIDGQIYGTAPARLLLEETP